jgi:hypothetical protein
MDTVFQNRFLKKLVQVIWTSVSNNHKSVFSSQRLVCHSCDMWSTYRAYDDKVGNYLVFNVGQHVINKTQIGFRWGRASNGFSKN